MEKKYDMLVSALDAIAFSRESDPVKLKNMARDALKGFKGGPTPRAADLGLTTCPNCKNILNWDSCSNCGELLVRPNR